MVEINNKTKDRIGLALVKKIAEKFLLKHKLTKKSVSIAFVGDGTIKKLGRLYLKKDQVTDVIAFPGEGEFLGEIIIDYQQIKRQAREYSGSDKAELAFILTHGLLHLLGHDDKTEEGRKKMEKLGGEFLRGIL